MANEKTYSPREVALAVLAKAQELLEKSELPKEESAKKVAEFQSGMHTVGYYSTQAFEKSESLDYGFEPFQKKEMSKHGMSPEEMKAKMNKGTAQPAPVLAMSEKNPDEKEDAKLGEEIEGLCESHMMENKDAERKEGHKIVKSESCKMCKHGMSPAQMKSKMKKAELEDLYEALNKVESMEKSEKPGENEIGTKFVKSDTENKESPSNPMKPRIKEEGTDRVYKDFESQPESASTSETDHREEEQTPPEKNPKEQHEGNNPPSGSVPGNGVHKLAFFMGHRHHKKSMKKGIALS